MYGNDIVGLSLLVEYQSQKWLSFKIVPKYPAPANTSQYLVTGYITGSPDAGEGATLEGNDLKFT